MTVPALRTQSSRLRGALMAGTILGAGLLAVTVAPGSAQAADVVRIYTMPQFDAAEGAGGTDTITITSSGAGTITSVGGPALVVNSVNGAIMLTLDGNVSGVTRGIQAGSYGAGAVTVQGAGAITGATGVVAQSYTGAVTISGTGATTGTAGRAIDAQITGAAANEAITITRSGPVSSVGAFAAIYAENRGLGTRAYIDIHGLGAVSSVGAEGIKAVANGGTISIGGAAGLSGAVRGTTGISASTTGYNRDVLITTAAGGTVTGTSADGINTSATNGMTRIFVGDTVSGASNGISARSISGDIGIGGAGAINGARGILALSGSGAITIWGSGDITATTEGGIDARITDADATQAITITRSGAIQSQSNLGSAIYAKNAGTSSTSGISISGLGAVSSNPTAVNVAAISTVASGGSIDIGGADGLSNAVSGGIGISATTVGTGAISVRTAQGGIVTGTRGDGINASTVDGATTISVGDQVTGSSAGVLAESSGSGAITLGGAGAITGATGIVASSSTGAITISGSGATTGTAGRAIDAQITDAAANAAITLTRSGPVSSVGAFAGIYAENKGGGIFASVDMYGLDAVSSVGAEGIRAAAAGGRVWIGVQDDGLTKSVSGTTGISASTVNQAISIMTAAGGRVTGTSAEGIKTSTAGGPTVINVGGTVSAASAGISATSASGAITVQGEGAINGAAGIVASSSTGAITIAGTGATTATAGRGIDAQITSAAATADLLINRSGAINASRGIYSTNGGSGKVTVQGVGAVTAVAGDGIQTSATSGATLIDLTNNVRSASTDSDISAVSATATGTGDITVKTAARVTITANGGSSVRASGIYATAQGGTIDIGEAAGLGGATSATGRQIPAGAIYAGATGAGNINIKTASGANVSATARGSTVSYGVQARTSGSGAVTIDLGANVSAYATSGGVTGFGGVGVSAEASGGTISITTAAGVAVTGGTGIETNNQATGATNISIGAGSTITGGTAVSSTIKGGSVTVNNSGTVKGSIYADTSQGGTATFNNAGTLLLTGSQANSGQSGAAGFTVFNQSGGVLTGTGSFGSVTAQSGSFIRPGNRSLAAVGGVPVMGTLTTGNLTLSPGATVEIRGDVSGVSDKVAVTGNATLGGATLKMLASPTAETAWATGKTYTVLNATGTVAGTFALATDLAFLSPTATYSANKVDVTMARNDVSYQSVATTPTQNSVGRNLQTLQGSDTVKGKAFINVINNLTAPQATAALETLSGSGVTGALTTTGVQVAGFSARATARTPMPPPRRPA